MKLLICDKIHPKALKFLKHNNVAFDYLPEITPRELLDTVKDYDGLLVRSRTKVTKDVIEAGKKLKIIGRVGSGVDNIHIETAQNNKITVINAPEANAPSVAEHSLALMLNLLHPIVQAVDSMRKGLWLKKELKGEELGGKTVGIVGYGHVGKRVDTLVRAFGAHPLIFSRSFQTISLEDLFSQSDIITLHIALTTETKGMVNKKLFTLMKPTAYIINTSRGEIVEEAALYEMLYSGNIAGAALDVFWQEPLPSDSKWRKLPNVILTPHIAAATGEAFERASTEVVADIVRFANGEELKNKVIL